ncbi:MAG: HAMP domain-containing sensor histidine kinase [Thermoleophilaceae bacterium]
MGAVYDWTEGLAMGLFFLACGAPVLALSHLFARHRRRAGSLARQFAIGSALGMGLTIVGVSVAAAFMFRSTHDAIANVILLVFAGGLVAYASSVIARAVMRDIDDVRAALVAVGEGTERPALPWAEGDEIGELAERTNSMIRKLDERRVERDAAESARRDLIAAISHDLRTPLASLQVLAEAIEDGMVDEQTHRRYLEQMSLNIRSLGNLIEDLFELSRLEAGDIQWSMQQVHLDQLVEETVEAVGVQAEAKRIAVRADVPGDLAPARANPEKLQRVLFNLIQNAIRHTPADGSVTVAASVSGRAICVEVYDTGEGIGASDRARVFEPFYRGGSEGPRTRKGAGLGLTICRAIVEAHGGQIWLAESDGGTRIRFTVPRG